MWTDAKATLEAIGLHVSAPDPRRLWVAAHLREVGGIRLSDDACSLIERSADWVAVFPDDGLGVREVAGPLTELVSLLLAVYAEHRKGTGRFADAVARVVSLSESPASA